MLRSCLRLKSTVAAAPKPVTAIPNAPETGVGPLRSSMMYFSKGGGFQVLFKHLRSLHDTIGPILRVRFVPFGPHMVSVTDLDVIAQLHRNEGPIPLRGAMPVWEYYRQVKKWPRTTITTNDYATWKKMRSSLSDHVLQPHNIGPWLPRIDAIAQDTVMRFQREAAASPTADVNVTHTLKAYTLESVSSVLFGKRMGCLSPDHLTPITPAAERFINAVVGFFETTQALVNLPPSMPPVLFWLFPAFWSHVGHANVIFEIGVELMTEKLASTETTAPDLLTAFLLRPELTEREAVTQCIDLLFAGVDTTSQGILWTLYAIASSPNAHDLQRRLHDEVAAAMGDKAHMDEDTLSKLPLVRACVKEALRLYPVFSTSMRIMRDDTTLLGYSVPKGTQVLLPIYAMSRDRSVFAEPDTFVPERWLRRDTKSAADRKKAAYATLPFGMGARSCAGRRLAETELYLLLAHMVRTMRFECSPGADHPEPIVQLALTPDKPLVLRVTPW
ncbi:hypothetical protein SPRG_05927, partial [Saprolegnia parasitica CBS 223.65]